MISHSNVAISLDTLAGKTVYRVHTSDTDKSRQPILVRMDENFTPVDHLDASVDHKTLSHDYALWTDRKVRGGLLNLAVERPLDDVPQGDEITPIGYHEIGKGKFRYGAEIVVTDGVPVMHEVIYDRQAPLFPLGRESIDSRLLHVIKAGSESEHEGAWLVNG
jgi:hypothetical protein